MICNFYEVYKVIEALYLLVMYQHDEIKELCKKYSNNDGLRELCKEHKLKENGFKKQLIDRLVTSEIMCPTIKDILRFQVMTKEQIIVEDNKVHNIKMSMKKKEIILKILYREEENKEQEEKTEEKKRISKKKEIIHLTCCFHDQKDSLFCLEKTHGLFDSCKKHLKKKIGIIIKYNYSNVINILQFTLNIDFSQVKEEHIIKGKNSKIPLSCLTCKYSWTPTIHNVFNGGRGCSECSGRIKWTYERLIEKSKFYKLDKMFDFSQVTKEHIIKGAFSKIPLTCLVCKYNWNRTVNGVFNTDNGCPECRGKVAYTYERVIEKSKFYKLDKMFDFSQITKEHIINGQYSKIPLTCLTCDYQ
jgi:hypothetical protein